MIKLLLGFIGFLGLFMSKTPLASFWFIYEPELPKKKHDDVK
jgi:cyclic lactone autoinducer peptide